MKKVFEDKLIGVGPGPIYVTDVNGPRWKQPDTILEEISHGGSKWCYPLQSSGVVLVGMKEGWPRMVDREVAGSQFLDSIGLLGCRSKKVILTKNGVKGYSPAIQSVAFKELAKEGIYVIDDKNHQVDTWIDGKDFLFTNDEDRFNPEKWRTLMKTAIQDVAKTCRYGILPMGDSLHASIQKNPDPQFEFWF